MPIQRIFYKAVLVVNKKKEDKTNGKFIDVSQKANKKMSK